MADEGDDFQARRRLKPGRSVYDYNVAWIAALFIERAAATALCDEEHEPPYDFRQHDNDKNSYTWARMSGHNIIIASLPTGIHGQNRATTTVTGLLSSCPHIKLGVLVGIGAGLPSGERDIRLGDIAVSVPSGRSGGILQYDTGKARTSGWEPTGVPMVPAELFLTALSKLQSEHELRGSSVPELLQHASDENPSFGQQYGYPGSSKDRLFTSRNNTEVQEVIREPRPDNHPRIFYGNIASGNAVIKDEEFSQKVLDSLGQDCICFEMEAAGVMSSLPCLVVRGISDYADANKNDDWQRYAAATAAAFTKELLSHMAHVPTAHTHFKDTKLNKRTTAFLQRIYSHSYVQAKDRNPQRVAGTCEWFTHHPLFSKWRNDRTANLLWISADPGCGKSVLARYLIEEVLPAGGQEVFYFFFKDDFASQKPAANAACAMLHQLLSNDRSLMTSKILDRIEAHGEKITEYFATLWEIFLELQAGSNRQAICVFDALDECQNRDLTTLVESICKDAGTSRPDSKVKILVLSRPYFDIKKRFAFVAHTFPIIHLQGDNDKEREAISKEIDIVIKHRIGRFCKERHISIEDQEFLNNQLVNVSQKTYLWAHLTMTILEDGPGFDRNSARQICDKLPTTVNDAYEKILNKSKDAMKTRLILEFVLAAKRPFKVREMCVLLALQGVERDYAQISSALQSEDLFKNVLRDVCGLFIIVVDSRVYLLHQTAREFLVSNTSTPEHDSQIASKSGMLHSAHGSNPTVWHRSFPVEACHRTLAIRCVWFLQLFHAEEYQEDLFIYCAENWPSHVKNGPITYNESELKLFLALCCHRGAYRRAWFKYFCAARPFMMRVGELEGAAPMIFKDADSMIFEDPWSDDLHLAAYLGLDCLVRRALSARQARLSRKHINKAFWWSVESGSMSTAELLLNHKAEVDVLASGKSLRSRPGLKRSSWILSKVFIRKPCLELDNWGTLGARERTALWNALENHDAAMLDLLLRKGADTHATDIAKDTPLHFAASCGDQTVINLLVQYGADVNALNASGKVPFEILLRRFSSGNCNQCEAMCKILDPRDATIYQDCVEHLSRIHGDRGTKRLPCSACVDYVLDHAPLPQQGETRRLSSALISSAIAGSLKGCKWFLNAGADITRPNSEGATAFLYACGTKIELVQFLQSCGASQHATSKDGRTALFHAESKDIVDFLVHHGVDVNKADNEQSTPLMDACKRRRDGTVLKTLLLHNANIHAVDIHGRSAIHYIKKLEHFELLISHGAGIDAQDHKGRTPLMRFVLADLFWRYKFDIVETALRRGADVSLTDKEGKTALDLAKDRQNTFDEVDYRIIQLLTEAESLKRSSRQQDSILRRTSTSHASRSSQD